MCANESIISPRARPMTLAEVAEEMVLRDMPEVQKTRVLLAIVRALSEPPISRIDSINDVTWLILSDPNEFERLLRGYWLLLGMRR